MANIRFKPIGSNKYEKAHDVLSDTALFDEGDWEYALGQGEDALNSYIDSVSNYGKITDIDTWKQNNFWDDADSEIRSMLMYKEFYADDVEIKDYDVVTGYDEQGKEIVESQKLTEKQYYDKVLNDWRNYVQDEKIRLQEYENKANINNFHMIINDIGASVGEIGLGFFSVFENLINLADALTVAPWTADYSDADYWQFANVLDEFRRKLSGDYYIDLGFFKVGEVVQDTREELHEWESKHTHYVTLDGERTTYGKWFGDTMYSIGQMIPSIMVGAWASAAGMGSTGVSALTSGIFYGSSFEERMQERFRDERFNSIPTTFIVFESLLETGVEFAVEKALGSFLGNTGMDLLRGVSGKEKLLTGIKRYLFDAAQESLEEVLQEFSTWFTSNLAGLVHDEYRTDISWEQISDAAIGGFVSSLIMGGAYSLQSFAVEQSAKAKFSRELIENDYNYKRLGNDTGIETKEQKQYRKELYELAKTSSMLKDAVGVEQSFDDIVDANDPRADRVITLEDGRKVGVISDTKGLVRTGSNQIDKNIISKNNVRKLTADKFGYGIRGVAASYVDVVSNLDVNNARDRKVMSKLMAQMHAHYKVIMDMYGTIGQERASKAEQLLTEVSNYASQKSVDANKLKTDVYKYSRTLTSQISDLAVQMMLDDAKKKSLEEASKKVDVKIKKSTKKSDKKSDKKALDEVRKELSDEPQVVAIYDSKTGEFVGQTIQDEDVLKTANELAKLYNQDIVLWDNWLILEQDGFVFAPLNAAKNLSAKNICKSAAERTIVYEVLDILKSKEFAADFRSIVNDYNEMSGLKQQSITETLEFRTVNELLFNPTFYNYLLNLHNDKVFNLLKTLDNVALQIAKSNAKESMTKEYLLAIKRIRMTIGPSLALYFCNNPNANLDKVTVFTEEQLQFIRNHRYNDLVRNVIVDADTKNSNYENYRNLMLNRINGMNTDVITKNRLRAVIDDKGTDNLHKVARNAAIDEINEYYYNIIRNKYDDEHYLSSYDPLSAMFSTYLQSSGLYVKDIVNGTVSKEERADVIKSEGDDTPQNVLNYRKQQFEIFSNGELSFEIAPSTALTAEEMRNLSDEDKIFYKEYLALRKKASAFKSINEANEVYNEYRRTENANFKLFERAQAAAIYLKIDDPIVNNYKRFYKDKIVVIENEKYTSKVEARDLSGQKRNLQESSYLDMEQIYAETDSYIKDLLNVDDVEFAYTTIEDILNNPSRYLKKEILQKVKDEFGIVTKATTALYLRNYIIGESDGSLTIVLNKNNQWIPAKTLPFKEFFDEKLYNSTKDKFVSDETKKFDDVVLENDGKFVIKTNVYDENGKVLYKVGEQFATSKGEAESKFRQFKYKTADSSLYDTLKSSKEDVKVSTVIKNKQLPGELGDIKIMFKELPKDTNAYYNSTTNEIYVNTAFGTLSNRTFLVTILHETQHAFQHYNLIAEGGIYPDVTDAMLSDIKAHVPLLFTKDMDKNEQIQVARNYLYSMFAGEMYARGDNERLWHVHPLYLSNDNKIVTAWGAKYDYKSVGIEGDLKKISDDGYFFEEIYDLNPNLNSDVKYFRRGNYRLKDLLNEMKEKYNYIYDLIVDTFDKNMLNKFIRELPVRKIAEYLDSLLYVNFANDSILLSDYTATPLFQGDHSKNEKLALKNLSNEGKIMSLLILYFKLGVGISFSKFLECRVPFARVQDTAELYDSVYVSGDMAYKADDFIQLFSAVAERNEDERKIYLITGNIKVKDIAYYIPNDFDEGILPVKSLENLMSHELYDYENDDFGQAFLMRDGSGKTIYVKENLYTGEIEASYNPSDYEDSDVEIVQKGTKNVSNESLREDNVKYVSAIDTAVKIVKRNNSNKVKTYKKDFANLKLPKYIVNELVQGTYDKNKDEKYISAKKAISDYKKLQSRKLHKETKQKRKSSDKGKQLFIKNVKGTNLEYWVDKNPDVIPYLSPSVQDFVIAADDLSKLPSELARKIKDATLQESDIYNYIRDHYDDNIDNYLFEALRKSFFKGTPFKTFNEVKAFIKMDLPERAYALKGALDAIGLSDEVFKTIDGDLSNVLKKIETVEKRLNADDLAEQRKQLKNDKKSKKISDKEYEKRDAKLKIYEKASRVYYDIRTKFDKFSYNKKLVDFEHVTSDDVLPDVTLGLLNFFDMRINDLAYVAGNAKRAMINQELSVRENGKMTPFLYKFKSPEDKSHKGDVSLDKTVKGKKGDDSDMSLADVIADTQQTFADYDETEMRKEISTFVDKEIVGIVQSKKFDGDVLKLKNLRDGIRKSLKSMDENELSFYLSLLTLREQGQLEGQKVDSLQEVFDVKPDDFVTEQKAETVSEISRKKLRNTKSKVRHNLDDIAVNLSETAYNNLPEEFKKWFKPSEKGSYKPNMTELNELSIDELNKINETVKELKNDVKAGNYNSKRAMKNAEIVKKTLAKAHKKNVKLQKQLDKKTKIVYTTVIGDTFEVESDKPTPEVVKKLFSVTFSHQSDRKMQFYAVENEKHMKVTMKEFFEDNAETLNLLTYDEAVEIVDYFENASSPNNIYTPYDTFRIYILGFILEQLQNYKKWNDTEYIAERCEKQLSAIVENASRVFNAWRPIMRKLDPNKTIVNALLRSYNIDMEGEEVLDQVVTAIKGVQSTGATSTDPNYNVTKVKRLEQALSNFERRVVEKYTKANAKGVADIRDKLLKFRRAMMLSSPATWARNTVSNVMLVGINVNVKGKSYHVPGLNDIADFIGKFFKVKDENRPSRYQYDFTNIKVSPDTITYLKTNFVDNGLLDLFHDGMSKYDSRRLSVHNKDLGEEFARMLTKAATERALNTHTFGKGKFTGLVETKFGKQFEHGLMDNVLNFIFSQQSDKKFIQERALYYAGKMIQLGEVQYETIQVPLKDDKGRIILGKNGKTEHVSVTQPKRDKNGDVITKPYDLSVGITKNVMAIIAEGYAMSAYELMHRENFVSKVMRNLHNGNPNAHFILNLAEPFLASGWNWFLDSLQMTPVALAANIVKLQKLERYVDELDERRRKGDTSAPDARFAEMLVRRNIGKGIIGTVLWLIGGLLCAFGKIAIDDDDDKPKLIVGNIAIDFSNLYGSSALLTGARIGAFFNKESDITFFDMLTSAFNQQFEDSFFSSVVDSFKYDDTVSEWFVSLAFNTVSGFIPNVWKSTNRIFQNKKVSYSDNKILSELQYLGMQILPGFEYYGGLPKRIDPYTGEWEDKYSIPALGQLINAVSPASIKFKKSSEIEDVFRSVGYAKKPLTGEYKEFEELGVKLSKDEIEKLNEYYGKLNNKTVTEFINNKKAYSVEISDGKYKDLYYKNMNAEQIKSVLRSITTKNANYAKVYVWTDTGHKYYCGRDTRVELMRLGITKGVYIGKKDFVK